MNRIAKHFAAIVATLLLAPAAAFAVLPPEMADLVKVKSKRLADFMEVLSDERAPLRRKLGALANVWGGRD